jgi:DNA-directed RNA polymerase specialized sigma subunit
MNALLTIEERQALAARHIPLALYLAHQFARKVGGVEDWALDHADFEGAALLGLVDAASRYTPIPGKPFSTVAGYRIRGELVELARRWPLVRVPRARKGKPHLDLIPVVHLDEWSGYAIDPAPSAEDLAELAEELGLDLAELLDDETPPKLYHAHAPERPRGPHRRRPKPKADPC